MPIYSLLNHEIEPQITPVEVSSFFQIPQFQIVGLAAQEIQESKERIRAAIINSGFEFPQRRIIVNLPPCHIHKSGTGTDFAIALAVLEHSQKTSHGDFVASGELALTGEIRPSGRLTRLICAAAKNKIKTVLISEAEKEKARETLSLLYSHPGLSSRLPNVVPVKTLTEAWGVLVQGKSKKLEPLETIQTQQPHSETEKLIPLPSVLEKSLLLSLIGEHHLLLIGPKGVGKSHALEWIHKLKPFRSISSTLERRWSEELIQESIEPELVPCIRASMQVKPAALVGSASENSIKPGIFSRAHGGYLLADEFPEWARDSRECLREPLEIRKLFLHRKSHSLCFPTDFVFIATGNLCPCGGVPVNWGGEVKSETESKNCHCKPSERKNYWKRLSGPVLDRIDLVSFIPFQGTDHLKQVSKPIQKTSERIREVRKILHSRFGVLPGSLHGAELEYLLSNHPKLKETMELIPFESLRDRHKCLRVALTLAALNDKSFPDTHEFWEAFSYRPQRLHSI